MTSQPDTASSSPGSTGRAGRLPEDGLLPDLSLYERLIGYGIATADERGDSVDHVTARRLAIWLAARPQPSPSRVPGPFRQYRRDHTHAERPSCASTPAPAPTRTGRKPSG